MCFVLLIETICASKTNSSSISPVTDSTKPKSKRGIIHFGNTLAYSPPHHHHVSDLALHLQKPSWITSPFARYPGIYRNIALPPPPSPLPNFALSHGGATITSYNINYPRYPILTQKPIFFNSPIAPPIAKPILPTAPSFIIPAQKPIIPVAISPGFTNQFPFLSKPAFPTPTYTIIPTYPGQTILPTGPHVHPQFIPIHLPSHQTPTIATYPSATFPTIPGPTIIANAQPTPSFGGGDSWRPIIVTQNPAIGPFQRPAISLLPPFLSQNDRRSAAAAQLELQSSYDQEYAQPQQLYQTPSPASVLSNVHQQHHFNEQAIFDSKL